MIKNTNLGDAALYCDFGKDVNKDINTQVIKYFKTIQKKTIQNKKFEIPVCCEKEFSLDIKRLEKKLKMKEEKIYESFFEKEFFCYMTRNALILLGLRFQGVQLV